MRLNGLVMCPNVPEYEGELSNKAGYTTRHKSRRLGRGSIAVFPLLKISGDGQTDGPTDGPTDTPSYRDARTHLKIIWGG